MTSKSDVKINFYNNSSNLLGSTNSVFQWTPQADTSILISDQNQATSHRKFIRRWNQLSRFQRSIVYGLVLLAIIIVILLTHTSAPTSSSRINITHVQQGLTNHSVDIKITLPPVPAIISIEPKKTDKPGEVERPLFTGPTNRRQYAVVESFKHAWRGYRAHAWGHDNLKPVTGMAYDWFSLGLTIVDSLDTAYIMGLTDEYEQGKQWVQNELIFTKNKDVNFFEVTIRVLGALLTNYHFTGDKMFLNKAEDLGDRLMAAFSSPSGIPYSDVNLATKAAHAPEWSHYSTTAEVTTVQLEFRELSRATKNSAFEDAAAAVSEKIHNLPKKHGLVPIFINPTNGHFLPHATITLGARGDSYYEYLLKQWLQTGKTIN